MVSERFFREANRLRIKPAENEVPRGMGTVQFEGICNGDARQVLDRSKAVLAIVNQQTIAGWPAASDWESHLPKWFTSACVPARSKAESDEFMQRWRSLSPEQQAEQQRNEKWSLEAWLYWMAPENRRWTWWDGCTIDSNTLVMAVEVIDWPFPWGALRWLFRAAGATAFEAEQ